MDPVAEDLKSIDIFSELSGEDLSALAEICEPAQFPPRSVIAREGFDAEGLFALMKGTVGIWIDHGSTNADLLAVRESPCLVGEMSVADELPRSATIVAGTPVSGYTIDAEAFRTLLQGRGHIALSLMKGISRLVRSSNNSFISELRERNDELMRANKELVKTQRKLVRQERLSSLGKFSSMILHDLRNPLSVIKGYADLLELKLESQNATLHRYASQIRRETSRLSALTGEWLDYSRGEIRLSYAPITMDELFKQLKENVVAMVAAKEIHTEWESDFDGTALLDTDRILRALINLVDNAQKACDRRGKITVSAKEEAGFLHISVKDDGVGMDEDTLAHVFDPFYSSSDRGGTGLGMHIVKMVVEAHVGTVTIDSKPGVGTVVLISLPLRI